MKAFYFATNERKLRYRDGRLIVVGETHTVECKPRPGKRGLHASERLIDALSCAPGGILYLVEMGGEIVKTEDKICATRRTYLAEFDANDMLLAFSCACALVNIELIRPYTGEFDLLLDFLQNPTREKSDSAARAAHATICAAHAAHATMCAAIYAARAVDSAIYAAHTADSAIYAAHTADSAIYAAHTADSAASAGYTATRETQNRLLTKMIKDATGWDI